MVSCWQMNQFDSVYSLATENHGVVTTAAVESLGVNRKELNRWVKMGRLTQYGRGVYRANQYPSSEEDVYAIAVAECGEKAYLAGESVLGLLKLAPTNPNYICINMRGRNRRTLPKEYIVKVVNDEQELVDVRGIPCQKVTDAIRACKGAIMNDRLADAAREAYAKGHIFKEEMTDLLKELGYGD